MAMNELHLVTKANTLITSSYDLSLEEQKIILTLASMVQPNDENFKPYKFSIKEFMELLGISTKTKYTGIPKITKALMQKVLEIKQNDEIIQVAWLSSAHYKNGTGIVELEFSPKLKPFMLGLKDFYTSYRLKNVLELKGKYSIRIYEILKSNEFKKGCFIEVDELRKILKADNGSYMVYQNFKNRVIVQAQKELLEKTDIAFEFEEMKTGRRVTGLKFYIKSNKSNGTKEEVSLTLEDACAVDDRVEKENINKVMEIMKFHEVEPIEAKKIYHSGKGDLENIERCYAYCYEKKVKNIVGYMIKIVKPQEFIVPKSNISVSTFNDFQQRQYDFDDLEKKLLGWENLVAE